MSGYTTIAELKTFRPPGSSVALDFSTWTDEQLQDALDDTEVFFKDCLNQIFCPTAAVLFGNGNGGTHLFMPQDVNFPHQIVSISKVEEVDFDQDRVIQEFVEDMDFQIEAYFLRANETIPNRVRTAVGRLHAWPKGVKNIRIEGTFGYAEAPRQVKRAAYWYTVSQTLGEKAARFSASSDDTGVTKERWEDYTEHRGAAVTTLKRKAMGVPTITGYLDIDRLLGPFVNYSDMFAVPPLTAHEVGQHVHGHLHGHRGDSDTTAHFGG